MDRTGAVTRAVADFADRFLRGRADDRAVCVALSGGADSLALTVAALRAGLQVTALVVDHGLQRHSGDVAEAAATEAETLGARARVLPVTVGTDGGMEAAARSARYAALDEARGDRPVLLAHTMDDQAETVLLGLARGSGSRSLAGMRAWRDPWGRPLLGLRRRDTLAVCAENGLAPHRDPHNRDPRFTRVRLRSEVLPLLDDVARGGVVEALARTAEGLAADNDALDAVAADRYASVQIAEETGSRTSLPMGGLAASPTAVRTRVIRLWLQDVGATEPTSRVIGAVDELLTGAAAGAHVAIGGDVRRRIVVEVADNRLVVRDLPRG